MRFLLEGGRCFPGVCKEVKEDEAAQTLYPITIDGTEILVGQTTAQTLLDGGFKITVSEKNADGIVEMLEIDFTGDDNMLLQYGSEYDYDMGFDAQTSYLNSFSVTKEYDVDWNNEN